MTAPKKFTDSDAGMNQSSYHIAQALPGHIPDGRGPNRDLFHFEFLKSIIVMAGRMSVGLSTYPRRTGRLGSRIPIMRHQGCKRPLPWRGRTDDQALNEGCRGRRRLCSPQQTGGEGLVRTCACHARMYVDMTEKRPARHH
jgi:hypothetical protein